MSNETESGVNTGTAPQGTHMSCFDNWRTVSNYEALTSRRRCIKMPFLFFQLMSPHKSSTSPTWHQKTSLLTFKNAAISRLSHSQEKLEDRTPSQLLRHMRSLAGKTKVDNAILRQLWIKCLSLYKMVCLTTIKNNSNPNELAETANKTQEL